jgi:hypothetical protein
MLLRRAGKPGDLDMTSRAAPVAQLHGHHPIDDLFLLSEDPALVSAVRSAWPDPGDRAFHILVLPGPDSRQAVPGRGRSFGSVSTAEVDDFRAGDGRLTRVLSNSNATAFAFDRHFEVAGSELLR